MNLYINRRPRIEINKIMLVKRSLPGKGRILVKEGQEVTPDEILGIATISGGFRSLPLAKLLAVPRTEATQYLQRPIGQQIYKDELLAFKKGNLMVSEKVVLAPSDGTLSSYDEPTDSLKIEFLKHQSDLAAAVYGVVEKVDQLRGEALIRTEATIIHGLLGSGKARDGLLLFLDSRSSLVAKESIKNELSGTIVVAGGLFYESALMQSVNIGVHGIITGGINLIDFQGVSGGRAFRSSKVGTDVGLSIIVTEGFGSIPIGEDIYQILAARKNKFAILDGNRKLLILPSFESSSMAKIKKTVLPQASKFDGSPEPVALELRRDLTVRVVTTPYFGEQGVITEIDQTPTKLESGILTYLVTVRSKTRKIRVPYTNVEAI